MNPEQRKQPGAIYEISIQEADGYVRTEGEVLEEELDKLGLLKNTYLYHAFRPNRLDMVKKTGTPHRQNGPRANTIDCLLASELADDSSTNTIEYMGFASSRTGNDYGMLAIYDSTKLELRRLDEDDTEEEPIHPYYKFKNPEEKKQALVAIVKVNGLFATE